MVRALRQIGSNRRSVVNAEISSASGLTILPGRSSAPPGSAPVSSAVSSSHAPSGEPVETRAGTAAPTS